MKIKLSVKHSSWNQVWCDGISCWMVSSSAGDWIWGATPSNCDGGFMGSGGKVMYGGGYGEGGTIPYKHILSILLNQSKTWLYL